MKWESVVLPLEGERDLSVIADTAASLLDQCESAPKVSLHVMSHRGECFAAPFGSCELTVFREKPLLLTDAASQELSGAVFPNDSLRFRSAEILLAKKLSSVLRRRTLYTYVSDVYGAVGYVAFENGELLDFAIIGWGGSEAAFSKDGRTPTRQVVLDGMRRSLPGFEQKAFDDLFDCFYEDDSEIASFVLVEKYERVVPPRRAEQ